MIIKSAKCLNVLGISIQTSTRQDKILAIKSICACCFRAESRCRKVTLAGEKKMHFAGNFSLTFVRYASRFSVPAQFTQLVQEELFNE